MKNIENKQKLGGRNTCTPMDAPHIRCNCDPLQNGVLKSLNREGTLSVPGLKTPSNNPGVDIQSGMTGRDLRVHVINMRNEPLIIATSGKGMIIKKEEKKMALSVRKVQLRRYGRGLKLNLQFLSALTNGVSLEVIR